MQFNYNCEMTKIIATIILESLKKKSFLFPFAVLFDLRFIHFDGIQLSVDQSRHIFL